MKRFWSVLSALAMLAAVVAGVQAVAATATTVQPLNVEDALAMREFIHHEPIALSPDGQHVAYGVLRPSTDDQEIKGTFDYTSSGAPYAVRSTDIRVTDTRRGTTQEITGGLGANWAPAWSPDGRELAFYSDRGGTARLWIWDKETDALRQVSDAQTSTRLGPQWTPDGSKMVVGVRLPVANGRVTSQTDDGANRAPTVRVFRSTATAADEYEEPRSDISHVRADLAVVDLASGKVHRVLEGWHPTRFSISPDGASLVFVNVSGRRKPRTHLWLRSVHWLSLTDGSTRTLVDEGVLGNYGYDLSWSPDSNMLAYREGEHLASDAYLVSLDGQVRRITEKPHPPFKGMPIWDEDGRYIYFISEDNALWQVSPVDGGAREVASLPGRPLKGLITASPQRDRIWEHGGAAVVVSEDEVKSVFHQIDLRSGRAKTLLEQERHFVIGDPASNIDNVIASSRTHQVVYIAEDAQRPRDLWVAEGNLDQSRQISWLNPDISKVRMGERRIVDWTGRDGAQYHGLLVLPSDYQVGRNYPFVMFVYPVSALPYANVFGSSLPSSFYNLQLLATRGYAVLFAGADPERGGEPMKARADSMLPAVDRVVEMGIADPQRLGVYGASAGGYSTLALLVQTTRFKAAMAHSGPGNLLSLYADLQDSGYSHGMTVDEGPTFSMPDHPWNARDQYIRNSPWFFLDRIETPLLLLHGTADAAVTVAQSNEVFNGLRRLGKEAEYARYEGEGHGFVAMANSIDAAQRYIDWFDRYLKAVQ
jgi:dipeptidyl aminopeptidase/acylaminoacyl peptidase